MSAPKEARSSVSQLFSTFTWAFACWLLLTWSTAPEQLLSGALLAIAVAAGSYGLGTVARPWALLDPRRLAALVKLSVVVLIGLLRAGMALSRVAWSRDARPRSGMVLVDTCEDRDGGLAAIGLLTSLTPDNQLVDVDRRRSRLLYYTLRVCTDEGEQRAAPGRIEAAVAEVR